MHSFMAVLFITWSGVTLGGGRSAMLWFVLASFPWLTSSIGEVVNGLQNELHRISRQLLGVSRRRVRLVHSSQAWIKKCVPPSPSSAGTRSKNYPAGLMVWICCYGESQFASFGLVLIGWVISLGILCRPPEQQVENSTIFLFEQYNIWEVIA